MKVYDTAIPAEWTDYNGHLRDAFYLLIFSYATDALMAEIGLDEAGRAETGHTLYTLEVHLNYLAEVRVDERVEVRARLLARDAKRLHVHYGLFHVGGETLLAASEQMLMNIDTGTGRSAAFSAGVDARLAARMQVQASMPWPVHVGRRIGLPGSHG